MKATEPNDDRLQPTREALERDAARMREEAFNADLHYATMRRVRALSDKKPAVTDRRWVAAATAGAAALVLGVLSVPRERAPSSREVISKTESTPANVEPARASAQAYQMAARQGDEALLAMLDRDARVLLPATASVFSVPPL